MVASNAELLEKLRAFRDAREWGQFHDVGRLIRSVTIEAGELLETVQWLTDAQINSEIESGSLRQSLSDEAADVFIYLLLLADRAGFDLLEAAHEKLKKNEARYPVSLAKGNSRKARDL